MTVTRTLRQLKYVGAVSRVANASPNARVTGKNEHSANKTFLLGVPGGHLLQR